MNLGDKLGITPALSLGDAKWGKEKGRDSNPYWNRSSVVEHSADNRAVTSSNLVGSIVVLKQLKSHLGCFKTTLRKCGREAYCRILLRFRVK